MSLTQKGEKTVGTKNYIRVTERKILITIYARRNTTEVLGECANITAHHHVPTIIGVNNENVVLEITTGDVSDFISYLNDLRVFGNFNIELKGGLG